MGDKRQGDRLWGRMVQRGERPAEKEQKDKKEETGHGKEGQDQQHRANQDKRKGHRKEWDGNKGARDRPGDLTTNRWRSDAYPIDGADGHIFRTRLGFIC